MMSPTRGQQLTTFLAGRDAPCPSCGYNLRDCTTATCPECGQHLALGLQRKGDTTRADAWWMAGVLGMAVALLIAIIVTAPLLETVTALLQQPTRAQLAARGMLSKDELPHWWLLVRMGVLLSALAAMLGWLVLARRRMMQWRSWRRIVVNIITATAPLWIIGVLNLVSRL